MKYFIAIGLSIIIGVAIGGLYMYSYLDRSHLQDKCLNTYNYVLQLMMIAEKNQIHSKEIVSDTNLWLGNQVGVLKACSKELYPNGQINSYGLVVKEIEELIQNET